MPAPTPLRLGGGLLLLLLGGSHAGCTDGGGGGCSPPVGAKWDRWDMAGSTYTYCCEPQARMQRAAPTLATGRSMLATKLATEMLHSAPAAMAAASHRLLRAQTTGAWSTGL